MGKMLSLFYGLLAYVIFFGSFLYSIGFIGNQFVAKSIDSGVPGAGYQAFAIDMLLLLIFAIQHSLMARKGFKLLWKRYVPEPIERSTYVLLSSLVFFLLFRLWRPLPEVVWSVGNPTGRLVLAVLFWAGWALVVVGSFLVNHFDLVGLRQVYLYLKGREYTPVGFKKTLFYKVVRHPIMLGYIVAFWSSSDMTIGHLLFAAVMTIYTVIGIRLEERDLLSIYGASYREYQQRVSMLLPVSRDQ